MCACVYTRVTRSGSHKRLYILVDVTLLTFSHKPTHTHARTCAHRYDVAGWCTDRGALATWNLGREAVNPTKADVLVDVDVALMAAAFHPEHPVCVYVNMRCAMCACMCVCVGSIDVEYEICSDRVPSRPMCCWT